MPLNGGQCMAPETSYCCKYDATSGKNSGVNLCPEANFCLWPGSFIQFQQLQMPAVMTRKLSAACWVCKGTRPISLYGRRCSMRGEKGPLFPASQADPENLELSFSWNKLTQSRKNIQIKIVHGWLFQRSPRLEI